MSALQKFAQLDYTPVRQFVAISEIIINETVRLADDVDLVPFSVIPKSSVTDVLDPLLCKPEFLTKMGLIGLNFSVHVPPPKAALVKSARVSPKFKDLSDPRSLAIPFLPDPIELFEACECITLIAPVAPLPIANWVEAEEWVPCANFIGVGWSMESKQFFVIGSKKVELQEEQLTDLRHVFAKFRNLPQSVREKLRVPIQRLSQSRRRGNIADRAIDLGVAFEALYLNDTSSKEQIAFTFRLRAAWHLGADPKRRNSLMSIFKTIYDCRSIAVHTGKLDEMVKVKFVGKIRTYEFLDQADGLCVDAIRKIIDDGGFPDWQTLILGEDNPVTETV